MATVASGKLKNARLLGKFQRFEERLVLAFSRVILPDGSDAQIEGYAVDPATSETSVASSVDTHFFSRWGGLVASAFLEGLSSAKKYSGAQSTVYGGYGGGMTEDFAINPFDTPLGCRYPLPSHTTFLVNLLTLLCTPLENTPPDKDVPGLVRRAIELAYEELSDKHQPRLYQSNVLPELHAMGKAIPIIGKAVPNLDKYIAFVLFSVFLPLLLYGLALAYYLPAIPFIRWISALAGWVILIVESLVAAPLWLCAHVGHTALFQSARVGA